MQDVELERLLALLVVGFGRVTLDGLALHFQAVRDQLTHSLFDTRQILGHKRRALVKIVIETVLDGRPNAKLHVIAEDVDYGMRQQVRGGVAKRS